MLKTNRFNTPVEFSLALEFTFAIHSRDLRPAAVNGIIC